MIRKTAIAVLVTLVVCVTAIVLDGVAKSKPEPVKATVCNTVEFENEIVRLRSDLTTCFNKLDPNGGDGWLDASKEDEE